MVEYLADLHHPCPLYSKIKIPILPDLVLDPIMLSPCYQLAGKGDTVSFSSVIFGIPTVPTYLDLMLGSVEDIFTLMCPILADFRPSFSYFKVDLWVIQVSLTRLD